MRRVVLIWMIVIFVITGCTDNKVEMVDEDKAEEDLLTVEINTEEVEEAEQVEVEEDQKEVLEEIPETPKEPTEKKPLKEPLRSQTFGSELRYTDFFETHTEEPNILDTDIKVIAESDRYIVYSDVGVSKTLVTADKYFQAEVASYETMVIKHNGVSALMIEDEAHIAVKTKEEIIILNLLLEEVRTIALPNVIKNKIVDQVIDEETRVATAYFGGYDIDSDLVNIVFTTEEGLFIYNINTEEVSHIKEPYPKEGIIVDYQYYKAPQFIESDKILVKLSAYEGFNGFAYFNITSGQEEIVDNNILSFNEISYDNESCLLVMDNLDGYLFNLETGLFEALPDYYKDIVFNSYGDDLNSKVFSMSNILKKESLTSRRTQYKIIDSSGVEQEEWILFKDITAIPIMGFETPYSFTCFFQLYEVGKDMPVIKSWHVVKSSASLLDSIPEQPYDIFDHFETNKDYFNGYYDVLMEDNEFLIWELIFSGESVDQHLLVKMLKVDQSIQKTVQVGGSMYNNVKVINSTSYGSLVMYVEGGQMIFLDGYLEQVLSINIPDSVTESDYWAITIDNSLEQLSYSNEDGLFLYDMVNKEEKLIMEPYSAQLKMSDTQYISNPAFYNGNLYANLPDYAWINGYVYYDSHIGEPDIISKELFKSCNVTINDTPYLLVVEQLNEDNELYNVTYLVDLTTGKYKEASSKTDFVMKQISLSEFGLNRKILSGCYMIFWRSILQESNQEVFCYNLETNDLTLLGILPNEIFQTVTGYEYDDQLHVFVQLADGQRWRYTIPVTP